MLSVLQNCRSIQGSYAKNMCTTFQSLTSTFKFYSSEVLLYLLVFNLIPLISFGTIRLSRNCWYTCQENRHCPVAQGVTPGKTKQWLKHPKCSRKCACHHQANKAFRASADTSNKCKPVDATLKDF